MLPRSVIQGFDGAYYSLTCGVAIAGGLDASAGVTRVPSEEVGAAAERWPRRRALRV